MEVPAFNGRDVKQGRLDLSRNSTSSIMINGSATPTAPNFMVELILWVFLCFLSASWSFIIGSFFGMTHTLVLLVVSCLNLRELTKIIMIIQHHLYLPFFVTSIKKIKIKIHS